MPTLGVLCIVKGFIFSVEDKNTKSQPFSMIMHPCKFSQVYVWRGALEYHLMKESNRKLVITLNLTNLKKQTMSHCMAWDSKVIYDCPKNSVVSEIIDRRNQTGSKRVFASFTPRGNFCVGRL